MGALVAVLRTGPLVAVIRLGPLVAVIPLGGWQQFVWRAGSDLYASVAPRARPSRSARPAAANARGPSQPPSIRLAQYDTGSVGRVFVNHIQPSAMPSARRG